MPVPPYHKKRMINKILQWHRTRDPGLPVKVSWLCDEMGLERTQVYSVRRELIDEGILIEQTGFWLKPDADISATDPQTEYRITTPIRLIVRGQVRGGTSEKDDLRVEDFPKDSTAQQTRDIPYSNDNGDVYLLEVVGDSMVHEDIREGDYVLVKPFPEGGKPREGQLVVAKYLPEEKEVEYEYAGDFNEHLFVGPTIKYYTRNSRQVRQHILRAHRDSATEGTVIETVDIKAKGRVIGVYREIR